MERIMLSVNPGICGFSCRVIAIREARRSAVIEILDSQCKMINNLAKDLPRITIHDLFVPHCHNPVFKCAERAHCHLCCAVPIAIIKAAEVVLELAIPQDVTISFSG